MSKPKASSSRRPPKPLKPGANPRKVLKNHKERGRVRYYYTIDDVASLLGRSRSTINRAVAKGLDLSSIRSVLQYLAGEAPDPVDNKLLEGLTYRLLDGSLGVEEFKIFARSALPAKQNSVPFEDKPFDDLTEPRPKLPIKEHIRSATNLSEPKSVVSPLVTPSRDEVDQLTAVEALVDRWRTGKLGIKEFGVLIYEVVQCEVCRSSSIEHHQTIFGKTDIFKDTLLTEKLGRLVDQWRAGELGLGEFEALVRNTYTLVFKPDPDCRESTTPYFTHDVKPGSTSHPAEDFKKPQPCCAYAMGMEGGSMCDVCRPR